MSRNLLRLAGSARRLLLARPPPSSRSALRHHPIRSFSSSDAGNPPPPADTPSSDAGETPPPPATTASTLSDLIKAADPSLVEDVSNKELKRLLELYDKGDEDMLPNIFDAIIKRRLSGKHAETDDELIEELRMKPRTDTTNKEFDDDFSDAHETDEEIENLYDAKSYVQQKMAKDPFFNMDDKKWDEMIREGTEKGFLKDTKVCEDILEDMLSWDKLLPDEIKQKVEAKFDELGGMCERGEIDVEHAYELFKEYEDKMVLECMEIMKSEKPPEEDEIVETEKKKVSLDDPPGEGPILRWESRVVFGPGGDAWHPKNRKVKLAVTVKELELSRHAFRRLRELVGKRYHSGRDELTIISERFEHREENRKDCLRTLYGIIAESMKADKLIQESRNAYVKERLRANPLFMDRLKTKIAKLPTQSS